MTLETTSSQETPPPLSPDRLSPLPNELLNTIFDLAYANIYYQICDCPKAPLSKRLRPFQERLLYRHITLSTVRNFHSLSLTLDLHPIRRELVTSFDVDSLPRPRDYPPDFSLDHLLSKLPNLVMLELPVGPDQYYAFSAAAMSRLSRVNSVVAYYQDGGPAEAVQYTPSDLAFLSALPNLNKLRLRNWSEDLSGDVSRPEWFRLRKVETLIVSGHGASTVSAAGLVNLCPNLAHLELYSWDYEADFLALLPLLPATLRSLRIDSSYGTNRPCESFLPRFRQLRQVHLGYGCYSENIHTTLAQLSDLATIRLGHGMDDYQTLASLVSGPNRLVDLKAMIFDDKNAYSRIIVGTRTPAPSDPSFSTVNAAIDFDMTDWHLDLSRCPQDPVGLRDLAGLCASDGIHLGGAMHDRLQALDDFHFEANNRAVLAAAIGLDDAFDRIRMVRSRAKYAKVPLPSFNLDSLDPDNLEIVETALPEKDWFVLSLKNKTKQEE